MRPRFTIIVQDNYLSVPPLELHADALNYQVKNVHQLSIRAILSEEEPKCDHSWTVYIGFDDVEEYCKNCGTIKNDR